MTISETFEALRARGEKALIAYVTAGDPPLDQLPAVLDALQEGGVDLIEVGFPFSDPIADGPVIQRSSQAALDRGTTPSAVLACLRGYASRVPLIGMGYANTVHRVGWEAFAKAAAEAGISGMIVSDLIAEEAGAWREAAARHGIDPIFLAAPTSTETRLRTVCEASRGFVYAISRTGVTGRRDRVPPEGLDLVRRLRDLTDLPVCLGFGLSSPEHVREACERADGAILGSRLVQQLSETWEGGAGRGALVETVRALKEATRPLEVR